MLNTGIELSSLNTFTYSYLVASDLAYSIASSFVKNVRHSLGDGSDAITIYSMAVMKFYEVDNRDKRDIKEDGDNESRNS